MFQLLHPLDLIR